MHGCGILAVLVLFHVNTVRGWLEAPYTTDDFSKRVEYGQNVTLQCKDDRLPSSYTFQYWIVPDLTVMIRGDMVPFNTLDGRSSWEVKPGSDRLTVTNLIQRQFGFYYCVVQNNRGETIVVKKGVNYSGPFFGNQWAHYKMNVIIGLCAAGVFLILAIVFAIIVAHCGAKVPEKPKEEAEVVGTSGASNGTPASDLGYHMGLKRREVPSQAGYDSVEMDRL